MKGKPSEDKPIDLYRRIILLVLFGLFATLTLVVIIIYSVGSADSSTWIGKVQQFILNLYPNLVIIPFTFLFGYLFFGPIQKADQESYEEKLLEKIQDAFVYALDQRFVEKMDELLIPMIRTTLTNTLQVSASVQQMGIIAVRPRLDFGDLRARIARSRDRVYLSDATLLFKQQEFRDSFQQTASHRIPLHILLLNPESSLAIERSLNLHLHPDQMPDQDPESSQDQKPDQDQWKRQEELLKANINSFIALRKRDSLENMELRLHSTMPALQIFICDNEATIGFYFYGKDSQASTQLEVLIKNEKGEYTPFGKQIEAEFETRWNIATPVQL